MRRGLVAALSLTLLAACGPAPEEPPGAPTTAATTPAAAQPGTTVTIELADRPFPLHVPGSYDPQTAAPLVVLLHGFRASGPIQEAYFQLTALSERHGFLYAVPEGTANPDGDKFWNATPACCDFHGSGVDDSTYLRQVLDTIMAEHSVDPDRVFLVGHSNGGFMAYRMACDHAERITAVVSLAGAMPNDPAQCAPARAVSVLQIHGTADDTIRFDGGENLGVPYPSVEQTLAQWRGHNQCDGAAETTAEALDLDAGLAGADTTVTRYDDCAGGARVELWTIEDGGHVPPPSPDFASAIIDFLYR